MTDLVQQILQYYQIHKKVPSLQELLYDNVDTTTITPKGAIFVTLFKQGNIVGSSGNVVEIKDTIAHELVENTFQAINDNRFPDIIDDLGNLKVRVDVIKERHVLASGTVSSINPVTHGVFVIKKDYQKLACILPNISPTLTTGKEVVEVLSKKLSETFKEENYIIYAFTTQTYTDY